MATVSSHVLDAVQGGSAAGVGVTLSRIEADGSRTALFTTQTDQEGRISESVAVAEQADALYELSFQTAAYFRNQQTQRADDQVLESVIVQLRMNDPDKRYHMPIMASPHSYSLWWSR